MSSTQLPSSAMQANRQIHQFAVIHQGDDVLIDRMFSIRKILRSLGFISHIYAEIIPEDVAADVLDIRQFSQLEESADALLFVHHAHVDELSPYVLELSNPKVMLYRHRLQSDSLAADGKSRTQHEAVNTQLQNWAPHFLGAIGLNQASAQILRSARYVNVATIPLVDEIEQSLSIRPDVGDFTHWRDAYNLLFVGSIDEHLESLELIELIHHLKIKSPTPVRLILAGDVMNEDYKARLDKQIADLHLHDQVQFVSALNNEKRLGLYRCADVLVCLHTDEKVELSLLEAMRFRLPIVARASSEIVDVLGIGGLLMPAHSSPWDCAYGVWTLSQEPNLRRQIIERQLRNLQRFSFDSVSTQLMAYLQSLQIVIPNPPLSNMQSVNTADWQIEGPFDSSYSLAIVNRELAKAIHQAQIPVRLRSHEGHGDYAPVAEFLQRDAVCNTLYQAGLNTQLPPFAALRFCYPPHLDDMPATVRAIHSYGWEETGFPAVYVEEFNRRLDVITVLSEFVAKTLRDSGVRVPIAVTGAGVDHLLQVTPGVIPESIVAACKTYRFLHISSCFPRKAVDVLLRAYGAAFRASDATSLIIKTFPNIHNSVIAQLQALQLADPDFPHVLIINEDWDDAQMVALYQFADAFVAPSRGEGLGLPMAEAMLFGLPVITTAWGGQVDFCRPSTAWLCEFSFQKAQTHMQLTHSLWAEPDVLHLTQLLKEVHTATEAQISEKTNLARQVVVQELSWKKTAQKLRSAMDALQDMPLLRKVPKIAWISTWNARCGIANYSHYLTQEFPTARFTILANHILERMDVDQANVLRCWTASQTENLEYALELIDEHELDVVVIQYNFSFFSLATLAATIENLKANGKAVYVFFHSTADVILPEQTKSLRHIQKQLAMLDRIFVHSIEDMNRLKQWELMDNVCYFPHGIALPPTPIVGTEKNAVNAHKTVIASYGFLLPHKGIPELIEAFSLLDHTQHEYHLMLVNALYPASVSVDLKVSCVALIARLGLENKVSLFTDFLSDAETLHVLAQADLIVFPYQQTQESSSAAVRVGLASGRPVAVTPLRIFEDVEDAVTTLPGTSPAELAQGIRALLNNPLSMQEKMTHAEWWLQERRWPRLSHRLLNLIDGVANPLHDSTDTLGAHTC